MCPDRNVRHQKTRPHSYHYQQTCSTFHSSLPDIASPTGQTVHIENLHARAHPAFQEQRYCLQSCCCVRSAGNTPHPPSSTPDSGEQRDDCWLGPGKYRDRSGSTEIPSGQRCLRLCSARTAVHTAISGRTIAAQRLQGIPKSNLVEIG